MPAPEPSVGWAGSAGKAAAGGSVTGWPPHSGGRAPVSGVASAHTASAVSRSKLPARTDSRAHTVCSGSVHRSWLQATAARRVWWRGRAAGLPVVRKR
ncbi:hypothetical protein QFZ55_005333 [Streptomyces luteogriseus]|nr:hypothetical protein [Streptomyces luteogriseus]